MTAFDLSLYLVAGRRDCGGRALDDVVAAAARGGATLVQFREKDTPPAEQVKLARRLKQLLTPFDVPLIVNDHLEVALDSGADGLHLGQGDLDPAEARGRLGPRAILGLSVGTPEELSCSDLASVDYVGTGPVYATGTKADAGAAIGPKGLRDMRQRIALPMVAIGGISLANAADVAACGVEGIAVVSAVCAAPTPEAAARALRACFSSAPVGK